MGAGGRPTKYKEEYAEQVYKLCLLGATDEKIADFFDVEVSTINNWKLKHKKFLEAVKKGKDAADAEIASSLFHRARGYSHNAVKIMTVANGDNMGSRIEEIEYTEHYAPDTTACIFWLKNRQKDQWRDKTEQEVTVKGGIALKLQQARERRLAKEREQHDK